jgi:hypothetical protein
MITQYLTPFLKKRETSAAGRDATANKTTHASEDGKVTQIARRVP